MNSKDLELLKEMLRYQNKLNKQIHPEWEMEDYPWWKAIWVECAELQECYPWKWWKKNDQEVDEANEKIELVDIGHFVFSWVLNSYLPVLKDEEVVLNVVAEQFEALSKAHWDFRVFGHGFIPGLALAALTEQLSLVIWIFTELVVKVFGSWQTFAKYYFGKNILNKFRQNNGYKNGNYQKIWNGKEDNYHLIEIVENIPLESLEQFERDVYQALEARYEKANRNNR